MLEPNRKKPTGGATSLVFPLSGAGLVFLFVATASLGLARFTIYVWASDMAGLASAGVLIFPVFGLAYTARYMLLGIESSAEGYDPAPPPPSPMEMELVFGSLLKLLVAVTFSFLPLLAAAAFGLATGPVPVVLVILGSIYLPMALLAMGVTGEMAGCFPGTVLSGIFTVPGRYLRSSLLAVGAGVLLLLGWSDLLPRLPVLIKVALDAGALFLLSLVIHRMGVLHREEFMLRSVIPFPTHEFKTEEITTPRRPMSDIERVLLEREKRLREGSRTPLS